MSGGPTGFEPGGARTLVKDFVYATENAAPADFPAAEDTFRDYRAATGIDFTLDPEHPLGYTIETEDGSEQHVVIPAWTDRPTVIANPPPPELFEL